MSRLIASVETNLDNDPGTHDVIERTFIRLQSEAFKISQKRKVLFRCMN